MSIYTGSTCLRCGCEERAHHHFRRGLDCGRCGRNRCWEYQTRTIQAKRIAFETMCYIFALGVLLGIVLYVKWIFF